MLKKDYITYDPQKNPFGKYDENIEDTARNMVAIAGLSRKSVLTVFNNTPFVVTPEIKDVASAIKIWEKEHHRPERINNGNITYNPKENPFGKFDETIEDTATNMLAIAHLSRSGVEATFNGTTLVVTPEVKDVKSAVKIWEKERSEKLKSQILEQRRSDLRR